MHRRNWMILAIAALAGCSSSSKKPSSKKSASSSRRGKPRPGTVARRMKGPKTMGTMLMKSYIDDLKSGLKDTVKALSEELELKPALINKAIAIAHRDNYKAVADDLDMLDSDSERMKRFKRDILRLEAAVPAEADRVVIVLVPTVAQVVVGQVGLVFAEPETH